MESPNPHSASDSYIGYIFQGQYALLVLFDAEPESSVSIETKDDVVLLGDTPTLHQIKHTLSSKPGNLTIKNDGFWNTLGIWANHADVSNANFVFVTCASVAANSVLECICSNRHQSNGLDLLSIYLLNEAKRVVGKREKAKNKGIKLPYKDRVSGCEAILSLEKSKLDSLLRRITIIDGSFNAFDIPKEVEEKLKKHVPLERRKPIAVKLLEWWEWRVAKALLRDNKEKDIIGISKQELLSRISQLIIDCSDDYLPDDYSDIDPKQEDLDALPVGFMEKQISLVDGKNHRIVRAAKSRWQAFNQRNNWMTYDLSLAHELELFDKRLFKEWEDKHSVMVEDTEGQCELTLAKEGRALLDWTHDDAPYKIPHIKPTWKHPFITRGSYQELSNTGKVGWHPLYKKHLMDDGGKNHE